MNTIMKGIIKLKIIGKTTSNALKQEIEEVLWEELQIKETNIKEKTTYPLALTSIIFIVQWFFTRVNF